MKKLISHAALAAIAVLCPVSAGAKDVELKIQTAPGVEVAGTLSVPDGALGAAGKAPLVILVSGTGEQNRDASNMVEGYAPHAEWARLFEAKGIATFRYDERGVGKSGGKWAAMTIAEHVSDVRRIIDELGRRSEIDAAKVIVAGHSEGSIIASMLAADKAPIAGAILLAGPSWTMDRVIDYQAANNVKRGAMTDEQYRAAVTKSKNDFLALIGRIPNMQSLMPLKPLELAAKIDVPVLIVQGAADVQVLPEQAAELAHIIVKSGNDDVMLRVFPKINHLLVDAPDGVDDYQKLPVKTLAELVSSLVLDWLVARFGGQRAPR